MKIIEINSADIHIDLKIICDLLRIDHENITAPYDGIISREMDEIGQYVNIKGGYRISGNVEVSQKGSFNYEGIEFEAGKQVVHYLENSEMLALFICTAGEEVSRRSGMLMKSGNLLEGYIADIIGSLLVEGAMDIIHKRVVEEMNENGLKSTNRYSPGYCKWKVDEQRKLFNFFPEGFCGVTLSESALMMPVKSVSGVFGIGRNVVFRKYACNACNDLKCIYRNIKHKM